MNDPDSPTCPHCGSRQLISRCSSRKVFIDHDGERVPLLTANFSLDHPVIEEEAVTYTCSCSWSGVKAECEKQS